MNNLNNLYISLGKDEVWQTCMSDSQPSATLFEKEIIRVGTYMTGKNKPFTVTQDDLHYWAVTFDAMSSAGIEIPVPEEHNFNPSDRRGQVVAMSVKGKSLFAKIKFNDEETAKKMIHSQVSVYIPKEFKAGNGKNYRKPILHVAITDYPVVANLDKFEAIAASLMENTPMLRDIAKALGIDPGSLNDEDLQKKIIAKIQSNAAAAKTPTTAAPAAASTLPLPRPALGAAAAANTPPAPAPTALSLEADKKAPMPQEFEPPEWFLSTCRDNRQMTIGSLFSSGRITADVKKGMEEQFLSVEAIKAAAKGDNSDGFAASVELFKKNEPVVSFNEISGGQTLADTLQGTQLSENPLVQDAKQMAKSFGK